MIEEGTYYEIEWLEQATHSITGKPHWTSIEHYPPSSFDEATKAFEQAAKVHGAENVRLVKITREIVLGIVGYPDSET